MTMTLTKEQKSLLAVFIGIAAGFALLIGLYFGVVA